MYIYNKLSLFGYTEKEEEKEEIWSNRIQDS